MKIPIVYNVRNLWKRKLTTGLTVLGIGLVVFVFTAVLMLANGFQKAMISTGEPDNVIFLRKGSTAELTSIVARNQSDILKTLPESATMDDGKPLIARELVVVNSLKKRASGEPSNVNVRGVSEESLKLRTKVKINKGRMWQPGTSEVITGAGVADKFVGCGLGEKVSMGGREWEVVGIFEAGGANFESEIWGDVEQFMQAFRRPVFSSMTMKMNDPGQFQTMKERIETDPRVQVEAKREIEFYEEQSQGLRDFIEILGITITTIFGLGAVTGAVITMYSAVANRAKEIGTLRALGFKRRNILTSFLAECVVLSVAGGLLGLFFASFLEFVTISTTNWSSFSEVVFSFEIAPQIITSSLSFAVIMGMVGGLAPAARAARMQVVTALRSS
jgi:ABC-type lipoprotein release transport system permease subunit